MDKRHLMYSVWKNIKDSTLVLIPSIRYVVPSEGRFVHIPTFASYILSPLIYSFIRFLVIKMDPSAAACRTCGSVLIKSGMKQSQGQSENNVGGNKAAVRGNYKL